MDQSYSGSDVSLSPSQLLERLQVLRQLQLLQRGKLQKQCLQFNGTPETSSSITEIVSHFSNSTTSYNTFRSLLFSPDNKHENDPKNTSNLSAKLQEKDLIEGVSVLNLSQESEFIVNSPVSGRSRASESTSVAGQITSSDNKNNVSGTKKQISLEEIPILATKNNFEELVIQKLENDGVKQKGLAKIETKSKNNNKKTFLKRGEGMTRFGLRKNDLVIQNTKALPWRNKDQNKNIKNKQKQTTQKNNTKPVETEIVVSEPKTVNHTSNLIVPKTNIQKMKSKPTVQDNKQNAIDKCCHESSKDTASSLHEKIIQLPVGKHPLLGSKTKSWASIFTKEKDDFLRQLKQSDYYKNFASPAKSCISDASCNESSRIAETRENLEQRMFELIENKVSHDSFSIENSFFARFLGKSNLETTGESTPITIQKCLSENPELAHIFPKLMKNKKNEPSHSDVESNSEYTECCSDECSIASTCSTCNTVEETNQSSCIKDKKEPKKVKIFKNSSEDKENQKLVKTGQSQDDKEIDTMKANLVEMNEKLVATSELLKERLQELEDEIETFRKENVNLNKIREEVDLERQKFYEEKQSFEQKFNEEKILSEYYLAEEKEKLSKQKQMYERYVREMRGRLNKKDKDEVVNLKKEISDLKDEIRLKDAKSTSTIARLRNQLKLMEKEKIDLHTEVEKLKKENKKIQHSNDITRRLSNMKYLEEINKKLTQINNKTTQSEGAIDTNVKYKAFEIERQSRSRKVQPVNKNMMPRAKSVPNLNVKSRYAKYFSQRDVLSQINNDNVGDEIYASDNESKNSFCSEEIELHDKNYTFQDEENNLENVYMERFQTTSPNSNRSSLSKTNSINSLSNLNDNGFFVRKPSKPNSKSPNNASISPNTYDIPTSCRPKSPAHSQKSSNSLTNGYERPPISTTSRSKSPVSILSNRSTLSQKPASISSHRFNDKTMSVSPEPTSARSVSKSNLNPTEIKKPDGSRELRFPNGNIKYISADGKYSKFVYYNGDIKESFYNEGRIKYFYEESKTYHTTHADGLEVLEFPDGQVEKRYKDGSSEVRLPNGSVRYFDPKNPHVREEWRFPDGAVMTVEASGEKRINFSNGQVEVHAQDHKRREFPDGTVKLVYNDGTSETRYASGRIRIKDKHGNLIMDSAPG